MKIHRSSTLLLFPVTLFSACQITPTLPPNASAIASGTTSSPTAKHTNDSNGKSFLTALTTLKPTSPNRISGFPKAAMNLVPVPENLATLPPLAGELLITNPNLDSPHPLRRRFQRNGNTVYLEYLDQGQEWLFRQNPIDHRRLSALLIDHREKMILQYEMFDLQEIGITPSWADAFALGVRIDILNVLHPTGQTRDESGIHFEQFVSSRVENHPDPGMEIWWSTLNYLPLRVIEPGQDQNAIEMQVVNLSHTIDPDLFRNPTDRFPDYPIMDLADWREEHHDEAHHDHHDEPHIQSRPSV